MFMARRAVGDRGFIRWQEREDKNEPLSSSALLLGLLLGSGRRSAQLSATSAHKHPPVASVLQIIQWLSGSIRAGSPYHRKTAFGLHS